MILTALTDVDVVLGMDVLSQFNVKIDFKKQVASPAREPCTPLEPAKTVGLLLDNPGFTFKGKIPVKEEGVEEVAKDVLRPAYRKVHRVWMASKRKMKSKDKREDRKIVRKGSIPWNQVDYKAQLKKDLEDIRQKLSQVLGRDLGQSEHSNVEATSPVNCIEGGVLVDLCMQRSGKRGSGCNAPAEICKLPTSADVSCKSSEGFPTPVTSPLRPPKPQRTERRPYSWRNSKRTEVCMVIRILEPSKASKEEEELKRLSDGKVMTSLLLPGKKAEERNAQSSLNKSANNSKIGIRVHKYPDMNHTVLRKGLGNNKREQEVKSRRVGKTVCDVIDDANITSPDGHHQETHWDADENRLVARKHRVTKESSFMHSIGNLGRSLMSYCRTITFVTLLLATIINVTKGLINVRPSEGKNIVGNSLTLLPSGQNYLLVFYCLLFLYILRKLAAFIMGNNKGICYSIIITYLGDNNKRLKRCKEILHNTRNSFRPITALLRLRNLRFDNVEKATFYLRSGNVFKEMFLAGKCINTYLCLFADFRASIMLYSSTVTVNLELGDNFKVLFDLIYIYIYNVYRSWVFCKGATYFADIFTKAYTLVYFFANIIPLVIKSHYKYQNTLLIRLGRAERANWEKRSIFGHNRSYWRELCPLVTPWTFCIKEGTEPWKSQKWFDTPHVQVRVPLHSLSLSLSLSLLSSCPAMIYCSCCCLLLLLFLLCIFTCKGFMTVVMNINLVINIAKKRKANLDLSIAMVKLAKLSLSLPLSSF